MSSKLHIAADFCVGDVVNFTTVFIHGIAGNAGSFKALFGFLKDQDLGMRVVAVDLLGAGGSPSEDGLDFGYAGQIEALKTVVDEINGPVVLVGHSMGTLLATKLAGLYPDKVVELILISPPIYTERDLKSPEMAAAMQAFQQKVRRDDADKINNMEAFDTEVADIVMNPENYSRLVKVSCPTVLIYGEADQIIAAFNIPGVLKQNSLITAVKTPGSHGVSERKFSAILDALKSVKIGGRC